MSQIIKCIFFFYREHIPHPSPFEEDIDDDILKLDTEMTLLFGELHTDKWLSNKPDIVPFSTYVLFCLFYYTSPIKIIKEFHCLF